MLVVMVIVLDAKVIVREIVKDVLKDVPVVHHHVVRHAQELVEIIVNLDVLDVQELVMDVYQHALMRAMENVQEVVLDVLEIALVVV